MAVNMNPTDSQATQNVAPKNESGISWKKVGAVALSGLVVVAAIAAPFLLYPVFLSSRSANLANTKEAQVIKFRNLCPMLSYSARDIQLLPVNGTTLTEKTQFQDRCCDLIFRNEQERQRIIPDQEEWESCVAEQTADQRSMIADFADMVHIDGAREFESGDLVAELPGFPNMIFKAERQRTDQERYARERCDQNREALQICQENHLDRLRVPRTALLQLERRGKTFWVVAEEKLPIIGSKFNDFRKHIHLMNRDVRLQPIMDDMLHQLVIFIHRFSLCDIKANNIPFLGSGVEFGLVDLSTRGEPAICTYKFQARHSLVDFVEERNLPMIRDTAMQIDSALWKDFDFASAELPRRQELNRRKVQEKSLLERGIVRSTDPIHIEKSLFDGLSPFDREVAEDFLQKLNAKLAVGDFRDEDRAVNFPQTEIKFLGTMEYTEAIYAVRDRIIPHLRERGVIFDLIDRGGHGFIVYC